MVERPLRLFLAVALAALTLGCPDSKTGAPLGVNDAAVTPQALVLTVPEAQTVIEGQLLAFKVGAFDPAGGAVTIIAELPAGATFDASTGSVRFTPGPDTVAYGEEPKAFTFGFVAASNADPTRSVSANVLVFVIGDTDLDGIPDDQDGDIDGDLLANDDEVTLGTHPGLPDTDGDGHSDGQDLCPLEADPDQTDVDLDGQGDACDPCPADPDNDVDQDGVCGDVDVCPQISDPGQFDLDNDGLGDPCDACPGDPDNDADGDGLCGGPPTIELSGEASVNEGATWTATGTVVDSGSGQWTATVDYDDGQGPQPLEIVPSVDAGALGGLGSFTLEHSWPDDTLALVAVRVYDESGAETVLTTLVTVNNVAPLVMVVDSVTVAEGSAFVAVGSVTDPGADTHVATVDYGQGLALIELSEGGGFALEQMWAEPGSYPVTINVTDDDGGVGQAVITVVVSGEVPTVWLDPVDGALEGTLSPLSGGFSDPGSGPWTAAVDWGDGAGFVPLTLENDNSFQSTHAWPDNGDYSITVQVTDPQGAVGQASAVITVANLPPQLTLPAAAVVAEGNPLNVVGQVLDPGDDTLALTVDYGLGGEPVAVSVDAQGSFNLEGSYPNDGTYTATVLATDDDGGEASAQVLVTVTSGTITVTLDAASTTPEGSLWTGSGSFTATGQGPFTATVSYGGQPATPVALDEDGSFVLSATFADNGDYLVLVAVSDEDGQLGAETTVATITNVAPTVSPGPVPLVTEGSATLGIASFTDPGADTHTALVDPGDGSGTKPALVMVDGTVSFEHIYPDDGEYTVTLWVTDDDGEVGQASWKLNVKNAAPTLSAGPNAAIDEGDTWLGGGAASDVAADTLVITVDYGDGSPSEGVALAADGTFTLSHAFTADGTYLVTVTATDDDGGKAVSVVVVAVGEVGAVIDLGEGPAASVEGSEWTRLGSFIDPGDDVWTATVDYGGDGAGPIPLALAADKSFALAYTWAEDGQYTVSVVITDGDGGVSAQTLTVDVANEAPVVVAPETATLGEGQTLLITAQMSDAGAQDTHVATFDPGDGSPPVALEIATDGALVPSHTYADNGVFEALIIVTDDEGGQGSAAVTVTVTNSAPALPPGQISDVLEGSLWTAVQPFVDPGSDSHTATVDYGQGPVPAELGPGGVPLEQVFADNGTYPVVVEITDDDGDVGQAEWSVVVANVPPLIEAGGAAELTEGDVFERTGTVTDPGADTHVGEVDWGDDLPAVDFDVDAGGAFTLSRTFSQAGTYAVSLVVVDDDGGEGQANFVVLVANALPQLALDAASTVLDEGDVFSATGLVTDPGDQTWMLDVDWGNGSQTTIPVAPDGSFALETVYGAGGEYTVTATVTDDDGAQASAQVAITVQTIEPEVTAGPDLTTDEGTELSWMASFSDPGDGPWTASFDPADGTSAIVLEPDGAQLPIAYTWADDGTFDAVITVTDPGGAIGLDVVTVVVANVAPSVSGPTDLTLNEGSPFAAAASFTDPGQDLWAATVDYGVGPQPLAIDDAGQMALATTWTDDATVQVTIKVVDDDGGEGEHTFTATVENVAPTVDAGADSVATEGTVWLGVASFTDPGDDTWTATVDYANDAGPGPAAPPQAGIVSLGHTWPDNGDFTVVVTVTDDDGGSHADTRLVTVQNVAPIVASPGDVTLVAGETFEAVVVFQDPGADTWTATVDYGDGSAEQPADVTDEKTVPLSHDYAAPGTYLVAVAVLDDDGGLGQATLSVTVVNAPPGVEAGPDAVIDEGDALELVATFTDPLDADGHTAEIAWGDGAVEPATVNEETHEVSLTHIYTDDAVAVVQITVFDGSGAKGTDTRVVTVQNVAPDVTLPLLVVIPDSGDLVSGGTFVDPGADSWTATVNYGDGSPTAALALEDDNSFVLSHTYAEAGEFLLTVTVTDDDGGVGTRKMLVRSCTPPAGVTRRWVGGHPSNPTGFNVAANWKPALVPGSADTIFVCVAAESMPQLDKARTVAGVHLDEGAQLSASGQQLTITKTYRGGAIVGGTVRFTGSATAAGALPTVKVEGTLTLAGPTTTTGGVTIPAERTLHVGPNSLDIGGGLAVVVTNYANRGLVMQSGLSAVSVAKNVAYSVVSYHSTANSAGSLATGTLRIRGNLTQTGAYLASGDVFRPGGTHVIFDGTAAQTVSFATPGISDSSFASVTIDNPAGVDFKTHVAVRGYLTTTEQGVLTQSASLVDYAKALPRTSAGFKVKSNRVRGHIVMEEDALLPNGAKLIIQDGYSLTVNGKQLQVDGALSVTLVNGSATGLKMLDDEDRVTINGTASFGVESYHASATQSGKLAAGELHLRGGLTQSTAYLASGRAFVATGTRVVFDGNKAQTVSFANPGTGGSYMQTVDVLDAAGVNFATSVYITGLLTVKDAGLLKQSAGSTHYTTSLPAVTAGYLVPNSRVSGHITLTEPYELPNAVNSLAIEAGRSLKMNGQPLKVGGNLTVIYQNPASSAVGYGLVMTQAQDFVEIEGSAHFTVESYNSSATAATALKAGTLRIGGNFTQSTAYLASGSAARFNGTRVVLDGLKAQTVTFATPSFSSSRFSDLVVTNPAGVTFATNVYVDGVLEMQGQGKLTQTCCGTWVRSQLPRTNAGYKVTATHVGGALTQTEAATIPNGGHLYIDGDASLIVNGQTIEVTGALVTTLTNTADTGLVMTHAGDEMIVGGKATFAVVSYHNKANNASVLTKGTLRLRGGFQQKDAYLASGYIFRANGTRVVFEGTKAQTVHFASPGASRFSAVDVTTTGGVTFNSDVWVTGRLTVDDGGVIHQSGDYGTWYTTRLPDFIDGTYDVTWTRAGGAVLLDKDVVLPQASNRLSIDANNSVTVAGNTLTVGGHFYNYCTNLTGRGLVMTHAFDDVRINGHAYFRTVSYNNKCNMATSLITGRIRFRKNFYQQDAYLATGNSFRSAGTRAIFDGTAAQTVSFANPGSSRFWDIDIDNPVSVSFDTSVYVQRQLTMGETGQLSQSSSFGTWYATRLPHATKGSYGVVYSRVGGTVNLVTDHTLPKSSNHLIIDTDRRLFIGPHKLAIGGKLVARVSNTSTSGLVMTDPAGDVTVGGLATFVSHQYDGGATTSGKLTAGTLRLEGGLTQTAEYLGSAYAFRSTGTRVVFQGSKAQTVNFAHPTSSYFGPVDVSSTGGVTLATSATVTGQLTMLDGGWLAQASGTSLYYTKRLPDAALGNYDVATSVVNGNIVVQADRLIPHGKNNLTVAAARRLELNGHTVQLGGSFGVVLANNSGTGLVMKQPTDHLIVGKNATFTTEDYNGSANSSGNLTAGTLSIGGNFLQKANYLGSGYAFISTGMAVRFFGNSQQSVDITHSQTRFGAFIVDSPGGVVLKDHLNCVGPLGSTAGSVGRLVGSTYNLNVKGLDADGLNLHGAKVISNGGALTRFDNVSFTGYSGSALPLQITAASADVTFDGLDYTGFPKAGKYFKATDTDGSGTPAKIVVVNSIPAYGLPKVTNSGFIVEWGQPTDDGDQDGVADGDEWTVYGTDPTLWDSDGDGHGDGAELALGTDPNSKTSTPYGVTTPIALAEPVNPSGLAVAHLDDDGLLDVAVADEGANAVLVVRQDAAAPGTFLPAVSLPTGAAPGAVLVADLTGDGATDIVTADRGDAQLTLHIQAAPGTFVDPPTTIALPAGSVPTALAAAPDLDGAPEMDCVVALEGTDQLQIINAATTPSLLLDTLAAPIAVAAADLNADLATDLVAATANGMVSIWLQDAPGSWADRTDITVGDTLSALVLTDLNGDGVLDIAVTDEAASALRLLHANPAVPGTFVETPQTVPVGAGPRALSAAAIDPVGPMDLAVGCVDASQITVLLAAPGPPISYHPFAVATPTTAVQVVDLTGSTSPDLLSAGPGVLELHPAL